MAISRLSKVALRELWKHEAHSFTHWMSENLDFLSEALGFPPSRNICGIQDNHRDGYRKILWCDRLCRQP